ncbi:MAG TPA: ATP-binding protein [Bacteroidia bacterium]|nr:ATP-binding protein [Bacteroidia bacterium]
MSIPTLILLRGLPGSGKSTLAECLSEGGKYPVFSTDHYFTNPKTGEYQFVFDQNHLAYRECQEKTMRAMMKGTPKIIVDNTFTLDWEMEPYFLLAKEHGYRLFVTTVEKYHDQKNIHQVTEEQIHKMAAKYNVKLF